jgi:hypothetical protein
MYLSNINVTSKADDLGGCLFWRASEQSFQRGLVSGIYDIVGVFLD